jgi:hypothetical protein
MRSHPIKRAPKKKNTQNNNTHLGRRNHQAIVNWTLRYLSDLDIPVKR